jgi:ubiquinone biosynthesis protein UbiJ
VRRADAGSVDAGIIGAPLSLLALAGEDPQPVITRGDVKIEGDAQIAQQFRELGDVDAAGSGSRTLASGGPFAAHIAMRACGRCVTGHAPAPGPARRTLPSILPMNAAIWSRAPEAEHFLRGVDQLREQLDRLDARLQQLERRLAVVPGARQSAS